MNENARDGKKIVVMMALLGFGKAMTEDLQEMSEGTHTKWTSPTPCKLQLPSSSIPYVQSTMYMYEM